MSHHPPNETPVTTERLPGIGRSYELTDLDGDRVSVVLHRGGGRNLFIWSRGDPEPTAVTALNETQARLLALILSGRYDLPAVEVTSPKASDNDGLLSHAGTPLPPAYVRHTQRELDADRFRDAQPTIQGGDDAHDSSRRGAPVPDDALADTVGEPGLLELALALQLIATRLAEMAHGESEVAPNVGDHITASARLSPDRQPEPQPRAMCMPQVRRSARLRAPRPLRWRRGASARSTPTARPAAGWSSTRGVSSLAARASRACDVQRSGVVDAIGDSWDHPSPTNPSRPTFPRLRTDMHSARPSTSASAVTGGSRGGSTILGSIPQHYPFVALPWTRHSGGGPQASTPASTTGFGA